MYEFVYINLDMKKEFYIYKLIYTNIYIRIHIVFHIQINI
jgi:hypothetical protein